MKKVRAKIKDSKWYPQHRFNFMWLIPTPFWFDMWDCYEDIVLGTVIEPISFDTKEECEKWIIE